MSMSKALGTCLVMASLHYGAGAQAACDVESALDELQSEVVGTLDPKQRQDARRILLGLCDGVTLAAEDEDVEQAPAEGLLGIDIRRADDQSRGHERLKKRR